VVADRDNFQRRGCISASAISAPLISDIVYTTIMLTGGATTIHQTIHQATRHAFSCSTLFVSDEFVSSATGSLKGVRIASENSTS
jgi:hypothetical protein